MKRKLWTLGISAALAALLLTGCGADKAANSSQEVFVSAAASLTDVMKELGAQYEQAHPNVKLTFSFGSSGSLQKQIEQGAPADLFFSAGKKQMDALEKGGLLLEGTNRDLLVNQVVLIAPQDNKAGIHGFEDVNTDKVKKIALGDQGVPVGQYAAEIFQSLGFSGVVQGKAVLGSDVRQVLTWVESGEVDCGVVYATDAAISKKITVVSAAPEGSHQPVVYPAAVIKASRNAEAAKAFLAFASSPEAGAVFKKYGFAVQ